MDLYVVSVFVCFHFECKTLFLFFFLVFLAWMSGTRSVCVCVILFVSFLCFPSVASVFNVKCVCAHLVCFFGIDGTLSSASMRLRCGNHLTIDGLIGTIDAVVKFPLSQYQKF